VRKPRGKKLLRKSEHIYEYSINMDLTQIGLEGVDWIGRAQSTDKGRAVMNAKMNYLVTLNVGNLLYSSETIRFSRRTLLRGVS
jgi:hypothetical protein